MKQGDSEYQAALDETVRILRGWAGKGRTDGWYRSLSTELKADGHRVRHRGRTISLLLEDASRVDSNGQDPMLSSVVVGKANGRLSG